MNFETSFQVTLPACLYSFRWISLNWLVKYYYSIQSQARVREIDFKGENTALSLALLDPASKI